MADDLERFWSNIRGGLDAITEVPTSHWRPEDYWAEDPKAPDKTYARRGGFITPVDFPLLDFGIAPHAVEATDTSQLLGLLIARRALADAGYTADRDFDRDRVSVILGVTGTLELVIPLGARLGHPIWRRALSEAGVDNATAEDVVARIAGSYPTWQENSFPGLLGNVAAGRIANRLDLRGTNCVVDAACASSLGAVNLALLELAAGRCDVALSGGIDTFNDIFMYMCFSKTPALSPSGNARPFDASSDGTILGEGLGILVLKRLEDARRDGDRIYAVIRSMGTSSDGKGQAVYAPSAAGQVKAIRQAYDLAGVDPATIELVEAHGTGTRVGDGIELEALEQVYSGLGSQSRRCALGSIKSQVGHTKAAAGAAGLIKAALALHHKVLPPTIKVLEPIEPLQQETSPFYLNTQVRPWLSRPGHPRRAAVSAFGFGGSNFHCLLEEAEPEPPGIDWGGDVQILAYSGAKAERIISLLPRWSAGVSWPELRAEAARSRAEFYAEDEVRLLLLADRGSCDPADLINQAVERLKKVQRGTAEAPEAIEHSAVLVGTGPAAGSLAVLFPGQGSQYVGMLRDLACRFPRLHAALRRWNAQSGAASVPLSELVYPPPSFLDETRLEQEQQLRDTRFAQPAIGAVSIGLYRILEDFGICPAVVGGHSFGELTALCAGGRIDEEALAQLSLARGALMAEAARVGDPGAMLAVFAPLEQVSRVIEQHRLDVVIANRNAPRQCVISGPRSEIERAAERFSADRVTTRILPVSAAFHSRFVAEAQSEFRSSLDGVEIGPGMIPVYANATGGIYPGDAQEARTLLASQLVRPVEFLTQIETMYERGARTFLEVGPDCRLTGLVRSILEGRDHQAWSVDDPRDRDDYAGLRGLAQTLAGLAALGYPVNLEKWDEGYRSQVQDSSRKALTVKVCGANPTPLRPGGSTSVGPTPTNPGARLAPAAAPRRPVPAVNHAPTGNGSLLPGPNETAMPERIMNSPTELDHRAPSNGQAGHAPIVTSRLPLISDAPRTTKGVGGLAEALQQAQEDMLALQRMAEQTALIHRQFLEGQAETQRTLQMLLERQYRLANLAVPADQPQTTISMAPVTPATTSQAVPRIPAPAARTELREPAPAIPEAHPTAGVLLAVVAEKTGYPVEMLDLDMQLDADLGIDSIKRVEILSALQDRLPHAPTVGPDQLGTLRTLRQIAEFLTPDPASLPVAPHPSRNGHAQSSHAREDVLPSVDNPSSATVLLAVVAEKTGYPEEMLELDMQLDADLGIDSIKRVEILSALQDRMPDAPTVGPDQLGTLRTLRQIAEFLDAGSSTHCRALRPSQNGRHHASQPETHLSGTGSSVPVSSLLLAVVAEKTGYPEEMLELDMQLDADLGIDSIKRVEILSALQDRLPEAPVVGPDQLGALRTLRQIAEFLEFRPLAAEHPLSAGEIPAPKTADRVAANGHASLPASEPKSPVHCLIPTAVVVAGPDHRDRLKLPAGAWFCVAGEASPLTEAVRDRLLRQGLHVELATPSQPAPTAFPKELAGLIVLAPVPGTGPDHAFVKWSFAVTRSAAAQLRRSGGNQGAVFATVSRLDGSFALGTVADPSASASGSLAALAKTAHAEWPEVSCKAIDLDPSLASNEEAADRIVEEVLRRGPQEIGLSTAGSRRIELIERERAARSRPGAPRLAPGEVVVLSGGARGITAEVAVALAGWARPRLVLLGRTPSPTREPEWLVPLESEAEIRLAIRDHSARSLSPLELQHEARLVQARREIGRNLRRIRAAGSDVSYHAIDVRDRSAVHELLEEIRRGYGPVRGLVHGAGVLADRRIEDQTDAQFAEVYDTKVLGLEAIVESIEPDELRFLALFSSSTARFGRVGQVAYATANECLNKWAQIAARRLHDCRVVAFNWGPWDGGMVTPAHRPMFEREGLGLIPLEAGARLVVEEIQQPPAGPVEIVVLAGAVPEEVSRGAIETAATGVAAPPQESKFEVVFERQVDTRSVPILRSHVIDNHAVMPLALILEWLVEGALHRHPGMAVQGLDGLQLLKGLVLKDHRSATVSIRVGRHERRGGVLLVPVELHGTPTSGRDVTHARAQVLLAEQHPAGKPRLTHGHLQAFKFSPEEVYRKILFHGPAMQAIQQVEGCAESSVAAWVATSPPPGSWMERPIRQNWLTDPLAIDAAFQVLVLWTRERRNSNSLPTAVGSYRQFRRTYPAESVRVIAAIRQSGAHRAVADIEFLDSGGQLVASIEGYECVIDASLNQAFRRNRLSQLEVATS
jgi:acyl transferase domain-containing protein/NAD(P)-dependent dehydrogenase (short-subunit alcohol dehydrogenase family)